MGRKVKHLVSHERALPGQPLDTGLAHRGARVDCAAINDLSDSLDLGQGAGQILPRSDSQSTVGASSASFCGNGLPGVPSQVLELFLRNDHIRLVGGLIVERSAKGKKGFSVSGVDSFGYEIGDSQGLGVAYVILFDQEAAV